MSPYKMVNVQMSNAKFSPTGSTSSPQHRHSAHGLLLIPANFSYFAPQQSKRHSITSAVAMGGGGLTGAAVTPGRPLEKRSPVNRHVQLINSEEEASVLSRYPFHGNRALPSGRIHVKEQQEREDVERGRIKTGLGERGTANQRWSLIDVNNNRVEREDHGSEAELMLLQPVEDKGRERIISGQKRQLTSLRSHSSGNSGRPQVFKSPPVQRYSNVYDYTLSELSLNAIYEDSDSN